MKQLIFLVAQWFVDDCLVRCTRHYLIIFIVGYSVVVKESFEKFSFAKKKIVDMYLKNSDFCPASTVSNAFTGT